MSLLSCRNAEMQKGYVKSSQGIHWGPEKELGAMGNDIHLAKPTWKSMAEGLFVDADFCEMCGKIIISLKKDDENVR